MNDTAIKVCGITHVDDIPLLSNVGVDYIGFVFVPGSKREITLENAIALTAAVPVVIQTVGVFMDQPFYFVQFVANELHLDWVQLHGSETASYAANLKLPVIKRLHPNQWLTPFPARSWPSNTQWLLDPGAGDGKTFDWQSVSHTLTESPGQFWLAGGLNPDNIEEHLQQLKPKAVDVSSGVERPSVTGRNDPERVGRFVKAVKAFNASNKTLCELT